MRKKSEGGKFGAMRTDNTKCWCSARSPPQFLRRGGQEPEEGGAGSDRHGESDDERRRREKE